MFPMKISGVALLSVLYTVYTSNDIATYYCSPQVLKILIFKLQYKFVQRLPNILKKYFSKF